MIKREFQDKGEVDLHIELINKCQRVILIVSIVKN